MAVCSWWHDDDNCKCAAPLSCPNGAVFAPNTSTLHTDTRNAGHWLANINTNGPCTDVRMCVSNLLWIYVDHIWHPFMITLLTFNYISEDFPVFHIAEFESQFSKFPILWWMGCETAQCSRLWPPSLPLHARITRQDDHSSRYQVHSHVLMFYDLHFSVITASTFTSASLCWTSGETGGLSFKPGDIEYAWNNGRNISTIL